MPDADDVLAEYEGSSAVVCMMVGIDQVGDTVADSVGEGDLVHCTLQIVPKSGRCVEQHDAIGVLRKADW